MPGPELKKLKVFIGTWLTTGEVAVTEPLQALKVNFVDIYKWYPGEFFLVHEAEGTVGDEFTNSIEIIGYNSTRGCYISTFFDSTGGSGNEDIHANGNTWTWRGTDVMGVKEHRCIAVVSDDKRTIEARHEKSDDGINWELWMDVILRKQG